MLKFRDHTEDREEERGPESRNEAKMLAAYEKALLENQHQDIAAQAKEGH